MELREFIRHMLTARASIDAALIEQVGVRNSRAAVTGAFTIALESRFEQPPSRDEVAALVTRVRDRYVDAEGLPPMLGEAIIRAAFGEEHLVEDLSSEEWTRAQLLMTYGMIHDVGLKDEEFESFLDEATEVANEIIQQASYRSP